MLAIGIISGQQVEARSARLSVSERFQLSRSGQDHPPDHDHDIRGWSFVHTTDRLSRPKAMHNKLVNKSNALVLRLWDICSWSNTKVSGLAQSWYPSRRLPRSSSSQILLMRWPGLKPRLERRQSLVLDCLNRRICRPVGCAQIGTVEAVRNSDWLLRGAGYVLSLSGHCCISPRIT